MDWLDLLEEAQAGIKIAGRNINNLRYADDVAYYLPKTDAVGIDSVSG